MNTELQTEEENPTILPPTPATVVPQGVVAEIETSERVLQCQANILASMQNLKRNHFLTGFYPLTAGIAATIAKLNIPYPDKSNVSAVSITCTFLLLTGFIYTSLNEGNLKKSRLRKHEELESAEQDVALDIILEKRLKVFEEGLKNETSTATPQSVATIKLQDTLSEDDNLEHIALSKSSLRQCEIKISKNGDSIQLYAYAGFIAGGMTWLINQTSDPKGFLPIGMTCTTLFIGGFLHALDKRLKLRSSEKSLHEGIQRGKEAFRGKLRNNASDALLAQRVEESLAQLELKLGLTGPDIPQSQVDPSGPIP